MKTKHNIKKEREMKREEKKNYLVNLAAVAISKAVKFHREAGAVDKAADDVRWVKAGFLNRCKHDGFREDFDSMWFDAIKLSMDLAD
jgi:hypothetical protein